MNLPKSIWKEEREEQVLHMQEEPVANESSESFAEFIRKKRKKAYSPSGEKVFSIGEHASLLGLSQEMLRKILNKQKPNQSRDCIIAICAALSMNPKDTNTALHLYGGMPRLDETSPRDRIIIKVLNAAIDELIPIETINNCLTAAGFAPLSIIDHRNKKARAHYFSSMDYPYKVLKKAVKTCTDSLMYGDPYNSLATEYDFSRYRCYANMWLDDPENRQVFILQATPEGRLSVEKQPRPAAPESPLISFPSLADTGEFHDYFVELQGMAKMERRRMEEFLNDTKNYHERISADIQNLRIHVFYETYNYSVPEFNEYYLFEYIDGIYRLTVSPHSLFMQRYLTPEEYTLHYGRPDSERHVYYDSLDEIEKLLSEAKLRSDYDTLSLRRKAYIQLKDKVDKCLTRLRSREIFVRNLNNIWEDPDRVCQFYEVETEYQCEIVGEYHDIMIAGKKEATFNLPDGSAVSLSLEDLYRAFELGFNSTLEICQSKVENGSIEASLK